MRYALVDLDGAVRESLSSLAAVRETLQEIAADDPDAPAEFYVLTYDDAGNLQGEAERGDEILAVGEVVVFDPEIRVPIISLLDGPRPWSSIASQTFGNFGVVTVVKDGEVVTWRNGKVETANDTDTLVPRKTLA